MDDAATLTFAHEHGMELLEWRNAVNYNSRFTAESIHIIDVLNHDGSKLHCGRCDRDIDPAQFKIINRAYVNQRSDWRRKLNPVALHPFCNLCRVQLKGEWIKHPLYTPDVDRFWMSKLSGLRQSALKRGILFAIDKDDLLGKWIEQEGKCALTGIKLDWRVRRGSTRGHAEFKVPSVDRIDSQKNYTLSNVQIVSDCINVMKNEFTTAQFVNFCRLVVKFDNAKARAVESELLAAI